MLHTVLIQCSALRPSVEIFRIVQVAILRNGVFVCISKWENFMKKITKCFRKLDKQVYLGK
jgi:hypothetical protein